VGKVKNWRDSYHFYGTPSYGLAIKLKVLKEDLKKWNETKFRNITIKRMNLWNDLNSLDSKEERFSLSADEKLEKERIRMEIEKTSLLEEIRWQQKLRVLCLRARMAIQIFFTEWLILIEEIIVLAASRLREC